MIPTITAFAQSPDRGRGLARDHMDVCRVKHDGATYP
jgi:hypothetical protein